MQHVEFHKLMASDDEIYLFPIICVYVLRVSLYLTNFDKSILGYNMTFGETIRKQRENKGLLLRQVAAFLEVDTAFISKLERNERNASREQVIKLAEYLNTPVETLLTVWLAGKILLIINDDKQGESALKLALKNWKKK